MVILDPLIHDDRLNVRITGKMSAQVYKLVRNFSGVRYSATHRCLYFRFTAEGLRNFKDILMQYVMVDDRVSAVINEEVYRRTHLQDLVVMPPEFEALLIRQRYSDATRVNYIIQFRRFLAHILPKEADDITDADVRDYMTYLVKQRGVSVSTQNQAINAIKFYLEHVRGGERQMYFIERPRGEDKLPVVLSEHEVRALLAETTNLKHRCLLFLLYASGLRISELLHLRLNDLDRDRKVIHVRGGKGHKDRITLLSDIAYDMIELYHARHQPQTWLFEGPGGAPYSARSVNRIIKRSASKAGILKTVSAHTLRHSFATHLLEHGTDLRYIQALLGHSSSRTTERYAHVTTKGIDQIVSPLDRIWESGKLGDNRDI